MQRQHEAEMQRRRLEAEQQRQVETNTQPTYSRSQEGIQEHTYELTQDYKIDFGGITIRFRRGEQYHGRILVDHAEVDRDGRSYNVGNSNTAVGTAAMILNLSGSDNTAVGTNALVNNMVASFNNGGAFALSSNIDGIANNAFGAFALPNSTGFLNTALGASAGVDIDVGNNINVIGGLQSGVDSELGELDNSTYISNIFDQPVASDAVLAGIDSSGKLGTFIDANGNRASIPAYQASKSQAMLNRKVEELQATVAQLTQQLKEQAAQIQKVSAQIEVNKPAPQVVVNKP